MSFIGDLTRARRELQVYAEQRMTSRVTIRRESGRTQDEYGQDVNAWSVVATDVPFRLDNGRDANTSRVVRVGEQEFETATSTGHLPALTPLRDGDWLEVTAGESAGAVVRVVEAKSADQKTALRVPVYEVNRPEGWS